MKNKRYSSRIISLFKNVKHRREQQFDNTDYDARSEVSRKSKSSVRSSITTKSSQLKGYLKSFSNHNAGKYVPQRRNPGQLNRQDGDDFSDPAASLLVSVDKSPSYSSPSDGSNFTTDESSGISQSFQTEESSIGSVDSTLMHRSNANQSFTCNLCRGSIGNMDFSTKKFIEVDDICSVAESLIKENSSVVVRRRNWKSSADSGKFNNNDSASAVSTESDQSINTLYSRPRKRSYGHKNEVKLAETTKVFVFDLPWSDRQPNGVRALYSGPVDEDMKPHGLGSIVVVRGNDERQFHGFWKHGILVSSLRSKRSFSPAKERSDDGVEDPKKQLGPALHPRLHKNRDGSTTGLSSRRPSCSSLKTSTVSMDSYPGNNDCKPAKRNGGRQKTAPKYSLGDVARTSRDMIIHRSNKEAIQSATVIQKFEQCFIKRSNGLWTAAILADRGMQPRHQRNTPSSSHWYTADELDDTMD